MQRKKIYMTSELRTALDHNFQLFFDILFKQGNLQPNAFFMDHQPITHLDVENLSGVSYCASLASLFFYITHIYCLSCRSKAIIFLKFCSFP
uniref:Uncharacterized protein n=1 Tax=Helianthus annuus TaxID=4232 RepID=A0A251VGV1_HELAN